MKIQSIDTEIIKAYFHSGQPDTPQKSAQEMKDFFDAMPKKVLIPKINEVIDELNSGGYGKSAYTVACEQGFVGTEAEWLASLKGDTGTPGQKGDKGDPAAFKMDSQSAITEEGLYLVKGEYLVAVPKEWDTDITKPFKYTASAEQIIGFDWNSDDSAIPYADEITNKDSLWGYPLLKYSNTSGNGTGATYLILGWDMQTLYVYSSDVSFIAPILIEGFDLGSGEVDFVNIVASQGVYGKGSDICGNFALFSQFCKNGIKLQHLISDKTEFSNALKGQKTGNAIMIDDLSPIIHTVLVNGNTNMSVTRYGGNLFDGELHACIISDAEFTNYHATGVKSDLFQSLKIYLPKGTYSINSSVPINIVRRVLDGEFTQYSRLNIYHDTFTVTEAGFVGFTFRRNDEQNWDFSDKIWINVGENPSEYLNYAEPLEFMSADGVLSLYPTMTLICESEITVEYNRDINKAFATLGG